MLVKECMNSDVITVSSDTSVFEADRIMSDGKLPYLLVVDNGKPVGVVTQNLVEGKIIRSSEPMNTSQFVAALFASKVKDVMVNVITVGPDTPVEYAMIIGEENGVSVFSVLQDGELIGIATATDFLKHAAIAFEKSKRDTHKHLLVPCMTSSIADIFEILFNRRNAILFSIFHSKSPVNGNKYCVFHIGTDNVEEIVNALKKRNLQPVDMEYQLVTQ